MGVEAVGETPILTGEIFGETHRVLEWTQMHLPRELAPEGPNLLVGSGGSDSGQKAEQVALFPLGPLPHVHHHNTMTLVAPP